MGRLRRWARVLVSERALRRDARRNVIEAVRLDTLLQQIIRH